MKYRLFVSDLDGTLLNSNKIISEDNKAALKKLSGTGVEVVLASGRHPALIRGYAQELGLSAPIIGCNGGMIKDLKSNEVLYINKMSRESIMQTIEIAEKFEVDYWIYERDGIYYNRETDMVRRYLDTNEAHLSAAKIAFKKIEDLDELLENNGGIAKVLLILTERQEVKLDLFKEMSKVNGVEACFSDKIFLDVMNKGVTKRTGIEFFAEIKGINREEIITIGDNDNDIQMLEYAGLGIAMGNATDGVRNIADYIAADCEDSGLAHAVYKIIEGEI